MPSNQSPSRGHVVTARAAWLRYFFPVLVGAGAFFAGILLDLALGIENRPILYSDVFTGCAAALLAVFVARYYERLRQADLERLRVVADVNHHIRNALTAVLYSVHVKCDPELIRVTQDAVARIDWALREVLGESDQHPSSAMPDLRDTG